jgi:RecA/RadA recombinase
MKINDVIKTIKKSTGAEALNNSTLAKPTDFLSTGSFAINRVISGSINNGFPVGRITCIAGASQSGKSLLVANTIIQAFKDNKIDQCIYFDSEGGMLVDYFERHGVDMDKIQHIPVISLEDCAVKMLQLYDTLVKAKREYEEDPSNNDDVRILVVLDSIGALSSDKLITDAVKKDQMVADMGSSAKLRNNLMRGLMMRVPMSGATLLIINHIYDDPSALFGSSKIKQMGGGRGLEYASHLILQCEKLLVKAGNDEFLVGGESKDDEQGNFYKGNRLRFFVVKNRISKPAFQATVFLDFTHGYNKWDGLIEDSVRAGFIQEVRGGYIVPSYSDKRIYYKDLITKDEIWNTFIDKFEAWSKKQMAYSSENSTKNELDAIENELNEEN